MYECRICRTIFRSLANFILHKRKFCTAKYDLTNELKQNAGCEVGRNSFQSFSSNFNFTCFRKTLLHMKIHQKVPQTANQKKVFQVIGKGQKLQKENYP